MTALVSYRVWWGRQLMFQLLPCHWILNYLFVPVVFYRRVLNHLFLLVVSYRWNLNYLFWLMVVFYRWSLGYLFWTATRCKWIRDSLVRMGVLCRWEL